MNAKKSPIIKPIRFYPSRQQTQRPPRVALVGRFGVGKQAIFNAAASPIIHHEHLAGLGSPYQECHVNVGADRLTLIKLPAISSIHRPNPEDQIALMYLLWGDRWPSEIPHPLIGQGALDFDAPDVLVQVIDATDLEKDLELTLELSLLGRPMVIALNRIDEVRRKRFFIDIDQLSDRLGIPIVPTIAHMGKGILNLFETIVRVAKVKTCPLPQAIVPHIADSLEDLRALVARPDIEAVFRVPRALLLSQLAENDAYFLRVLGERFPELSQKIEAARQIAEAKLPRTLPDEVHADRHHRAALLFEAVSQTQTSFPDKRWQHLLDHLFLHPRWGLLGCAIVFALVLVTVLKVSTFIDSITAAPLAEWVGEWTPESTLGVVGKAVADGLVGLIGIVAPYMLPLVLLLVMLEESGVMHRVAFVLDRGFHRIGLHGGVAVSFLVGLGCNVPAISSAAMTGSRQERVVAAILITFVPCSARSAILLAIGSKFLGAWGVFYILLLIPLTIAILGKWLSRHFTDTTPGMILHIPPYALPKLKTVLQKAWNRTEDILTIVTPLLVLGSVVLALLAHFGAETFINTLLLPITTWWLGLPDSLGVPLLFGVLRKELSMLMVYQALGTHDIASLLTPQQIFTFLVFITFYVPCLSTFAVIYRVIGSREAYWSLAISMLTALGLAGAYRFGFLLYTLLL